MLFSGGVNRAFLVGKIAGDPTWQVIGGKRLLCFQLLTTEPFWKVNTKQDHLEFHNIKIPPDLVENGASIQKDDMVYVQGRMQTRVVWEGPIKCYKTEILVFNIERMSAKAQSIPADVDA